MRYFAVYFSAGLLAGLLVTFTVSSRAQDLPKASPQFKKLVMTAGEWRGTGTYTENGTVTPIKAKHKTTVFADGLGVQVEETATGQGMPVYKALNMFGFDEGSGLIHLYTVDNYGDVHDHKGAWSDDNTLKLRYEGVAKGKKFVEEITSTFNGANEFHIVSVVSLDDVKTSTYDVTMKRATAVPAKK